MTTDQAVDVIRPLLPPSRMDAGQRARSLAEDVVGVTTRDAAASVLQARLSWPDADRIAAALDDAGLLRAGGGAAADRARSRTVTATASTHLTLTIGGKPCVLHRDRLTTAYLLMLDAQTSTPDRVGRAVLDALEHGYGVDHWEAMRLTLAAAHCLRNNIEP